MVRVRFTGSRYALRDGPTFETGDEYDVDADTADRLTQRGDFEVVKTSDDSVPEESGPPDKDYADMTYEAVYNFAAEAGVSGRSSMTKQELIDALEDE